MDEGYNDQQAEDAEKAAMLQCMLKDNEHLERENLLLEAFLEKQNTSSSVYEDMPIQKKKEKRRKDGKHEAFQRLTDEEKNDVVGQAVEEVQAQIEQTRVAGEKDVDDIRTLMEEVDMRMTEAKKDTYEFKRDIIIGGEDPRTGKTSAEKMLRFLEDKIHAKEVLIEKLALKNSTNKALIAKLEAQLAHKEEMGEVLHLVDFDQLKIENQQYMERIDAKNKELLQLKLSTGKTVQMLNDIKARLNSLVAHGQQLRRQMAEREAELGSFQTDFSSTEKQAKTEERTFRRQQGQQHDIDQPQIMDYIKVKHEVAEAEKHVADWKRKVEIAELEASRTSHMLKQVNSIRASGISRISSSPAGSLQGTQRSMQ